jgi:hypothetical protein
MLACGTNACVVWLWHLPRQLADSSYLVAKTFPVFVDNDEHSPPTTATITSLPPDNVICLRGHSSNVPAVEFSPCGRLLASCSIDSSVRLWCTLTGSCVQQISTSVREPVAELESRLWLWTVRFIPRDDTPQNTPTSDPLKVTTLHNQVLAEHPVSNNEPNGTEFSAQALRRYMLLYTSKYDIILYQDLCLPQSTSPTIGSLSEVISKVNDDPSTYTFDNATSHPVFSAYYRPNSQMPQSRVRAVLWSSYLWDGHIIFNQPLIDGRNGQTVGWLICDRLGAIALIRLKRVNNTTAADTVELVQIKGEWINDTINWDSRQAKEGERIIATDQRPSASPTEMELVRSGLYALRSFANPVIGVFTSFHGRSDSVEEPHFNIYTVYADGSLTCIQFFMADFK